MAEESATIVDPDPLDSKWFISVRIIGLILIILSFAIHYFNPANKSPSSRKLKQIFFDNIIIFICIANGLFTISLITRSICIGCRPSRYCASYTYLTAKILTFMFFVHRAQLVQGSKSILPKAWFDTTFPLIFIGIWLIYMVGLTLSLLKETETCLEYKNDFLESLSPSYCHVIVIQEGVSAVIVIGLIIDMSICSVLLFLFIKPLIDNLRVENLGQIDGDKQMESRMRMKHISLLKWSITMTFINLASSNLALIGSTIISHREQMSRYYLGLDPAINTITSILMITGNRELLYSIFCKWCQGEEIVSVIEGVGTNEQTSNKTSAGSHAPANFVAEETERKEEDGISIEMATVLTQEMEESLFLTFQSSQVQCLKECLEMGFPEDFVDALLKKFEQRYEQQRNP